MTVSIVWFRQDLRLDDHPALLAAVARRGAVIPLFIWSPQEEGPWAPASASRWWLHHSLTALARSLERLGSRLILRTGEALATLQAVLRETGASAVFWNRRYEPTVIARDATVKTQLRQQGVQTASFNSALLFEPWQVSTKQGGPYQVYTPFYKACTLLTSEEPRSAPTTLPAPPQWPASLALAELRLEPTIDWAGGMRASWTPGEAGARQRLEAFLPRAIKSYKDERDRPDLTSTSSLSPHLHHGEISPRRLWKLVQERFAGQVPMPSGPEVYLKEVFWREFAHHLLFHFPHTTEAPLRGEFARFPWRSDPGELRAWQRGRTGYPLIDAGMRQLWSTGWMHNRVRMVVASFLVKDLLLPWQEGARWFWDTLVDADLANNTLGWQWSAGCGADAAPYFRIFNPVQQGERFDPVGAYVAHWVPELARLPARWIHKPWLAPADVLTAAGVELGQTYPRPIVDHASARARALEALATLSSPSSAVPRSEK